MVRAAFAPGACLLGVLFAAGPVWSQGSDEAGANGPTPPDAASAGALTEEDRAALAFLDGLGLPHLGGKPYVRVFTGEMRGGCRGPAEVWRTGFLLEEDEESFTCVHDLWPVTYRKAAPVDPKARTPRYERLDLLASLDRHATGGGQPAQLAWSDLARSRGRPSRNLELLLLGRVAHQNDHRSIAAYLLAMARGAKHATPRLRARQQPGRRWVRQPPVRRSRPVDLDLLLRTELPRVLLWAAIDGCGDPNTPRVVLRDRFRLISERFGGSSVSTPASAYAADLDAMLAEELSEPAEPAPRALGEELLELEEPAQDLIAGLKDLSARTVNRSPTAHFAQSHGASARLLALGHSAVPSLLEVVDDRRLTRVIHHYPRPRVPERFVLRYGDVALQILSHHAGREFGSAEEARDWWDAVRDRGEEEVLADMVREGRSDAPALAHRLAALDRDRALDAAIDAASRMRGRQRERLVSFVGAHKGPRVEAFLLREVRTGPDLRASMTAARTLAARGSAVWCEPLVAEVRRQSLANAQRSSREVRDALRLVVRRGNLRGLESLRRAYPDLSREERRYLIEAVAALPQGLSDRSALGEAVLVRALEDETAHPGTWVHHGIRCVDVRLGEMAAVVLGLRLGRPFDLNAPFFARDRNRVELANAWSRARGLPGRSVPDLPPAPASADPIALAAAWQSLASARTPREVDLALARYGVLGLSGLPTLCGQVAGGLPPVAFERALTATKRLASVVRQVRLEDRADVLDPAQVNALRGLVGRPLDLSELIGLLGEITAREAVGVDLTLHRDGQGRGVALRLSLALGEEEPTRVRLLYSLRIGERFQRGSHLVVPGRTRHDWSRFEGRVARLVDGVPDVSGELRLRVGSY
jgi:hypothetical protein